MNADYDRVVAQLDPNDVNYADGCLLIADGVWRAYELTQFIKGPDEAKTADLSAGLAAKPHGNILKCPRVERRPVGWPAARNN
jgi:hypothetical protein